MRQLGGLGANSEVEIRVQKFVGCAWNQQLWEGRGQDWAEVTSQVGKRQSQQKLQPGLYVINQPWGAAHPGKAVI